MVAPLAVAFIASSAMKFGSSFLAANEQRQAAKSELKQLEMQRRQIQLERANMADQYVDKRTQMIGSVKQTAGHNGLRVSGSIADTLNESLTQLNMEEAQNDYNMRMQLETNRLQQKNAKRTIKYAYVNALLGGGASALSSASTYNHYWGSNAGTNMGG